MQSRVFQLSLAMLLVGCGAEGANSPPPAPTPEEVTRASVDLLPTRRSKVRGMFRLTAVEQGVLLKGRVGPLARGIYGLGIHDGDCSAHDAKSAGAYVGPVDSDGRPLGRLDDITSAEDELAKVNMTDTRLTLSGPGSIVGKALVVHAWPFDPAVDLERVPFLACGVIRAE